MKIENKEMLLYSMDKAIDEAKIATQGEDIQEVYYRVGTAVHWIVNCMDRVFECVYFSEEDKKLRFAFHAANNALKHRCDLITLHKKNHGLSFPFTLPFGKDERLDDDSTDIDSLDAFEYTIERDMKYLIEEVEDV